MKTKTKT